MVLESFYEDCEFGAHTRGPEDLFWMYGWFRVDVM